MAMSTFGKVDRCCGVKVGKFRLQTSTKPGFPTARNGGGGPVQEGPLRCCIQGAAQALPGLPWARLRQARELPIGAPDAGYGHNGAGITEGYADGFCDGVGRSYAECSWDI